VSLRRLLISAAVLLVLCTVVFLIYWGYLYKQEKPQDGNILPAAGVTPTDRVLILAPHCDDESIGSAGVIYDTLRAGGQVLVVIVTNGDGFTFAAEEQFKRLFLTKDDYIASGYARQRESLAALDRLGLPADKVIFLGYPDRGLEFLWTQHWPSDKPFKSRYTESDHSPYSNSYTPGAVYAGQNLFANLEQIIAAFKPTVIVLPHPNDEHRDHATTYAFTAAVLYKQNAAGLPMPRLQYYLVHRGDYPIPHGFLPDAPLLPPQPLLRLNSVTWSSYALDTEHRQIKATALEEYVSQLKVPIMSGLLKSFVRTNELFATLPTPILKTADNSGGAVTTLLLNNPVAVYPASFIEHRSRVRAIYGQLSSGAILLRLQTAGNINTRLSYTIDYVGFKLENGMLTRDWQVLYYGREKTSPAVTIADDSLSLRVEPPNGVLPDYFFIKIITRDRWGFIIDATPWYMIDIVE
jgi:LmbE family N-acetylglucosaminyl deacetylase